MEILDDVVALFGGCFGSLEVFTLLLDGAAIYLGSKLLQKHQRAAGHSHKKQSWKPFVVLLVFALAFTGLTIYKYAQPAR